MKKNEMKFKTIVREIESSYNVEVRDGVCLWIFKFAIKNLMKNSITFHDEKLCQRYKVLANSIN